MKNAVNPTVFPCDKRREKRVLIPQLSSLALHLFHGVIAADRGCRLTTTGIQGIEPLYTLDTGPRRPHRDELSSGTSLVETPTH